MKCKFCGSDGVLPIKKIQSPYVDYEYTLYYCNYCKCRFFDIKEHDVDIKKLYEDLSVKHNKEVPSSKLKKDICWSRQVKRIEKISNKKISSVLDIGCRTGDFLMHFSDSIVREGVELSKNSAGICKKRGLRVYQDFVENINFDKQYDVVTCYAIFEHLIDPLVVLDKISGILPQGGVLVIMIPTCECFKRWVIDKFTSKRWYLYSPPEHLNFFSTHFLDRYLYQNNFKLMDRYWTCGGSFNVFRNVPILNYFLRKSIPTLTEYTPINKLPIFDHLYSYYVKK